VVETALRMATSADADGETARTATERRADAFVDLCRFFLDHQDERDGGRHRPHVNVVVSLPEILAGTGEGVGIDGIRLDPASIRAMLCDSSVHRVVTDGGSTILDYGRATRDISTALFVALALRDGHCRHPGCDRKPMWCEAHHVIPWEIGGLTNLANLVLKCSRHHHLGHRPGWSEKLKPDGTLVLTAPDGREWETRPAGTLVQPELPLPDRSELAAGNDGAPTAGEIVATSADDWAQKWAASGATGSPPDVSDVDFDSEVAVALFLGEKPTGGWRIGSDVDVKVQGQFGAVIYEALGPGDGCNTTQALTHPYLALAVKSKNLRFESSERKVPCD
jgi:hypothetical protein